MPATRILRNTGVRLTRSTTSSSSVTVVRMLMILPVCHQADHFAQSGDARPSRDKRERLLSL